MLQFKSQTCLDSQIKPYNFWGKVPAPPKISLDQNMKRLKVEDKIYRYLVQNFFFWRFLSIGASGANFAVGWYTIIEHIQFYII